MVAIVGRVVFWRHVEPVKGLVDALKECGEQAQITVIPDIVDELSAGHVDIPELIDWMLAHSRE